MKKFLLLIIVLALAYYCYENKDEFFSLKDNAVGKIKNFTASKAGEMTFEEALVSGKPVIAKLGASWCPPCRQMAPIIEELKQELAGQAVVLDIDIQQRPDLAKTYNVRYIPLTLFFNSEGHLVTQQVGFMTKEQVLDKFNSM